MLNWLFIRTPDGASVLQVLILGTLLIISLHILLKDIKTIIDDIRSDDGDDNIPSEEK